VFREIAERLGLETDHLNDKYAEARQAYREKPPELTDNQKSRNFIAGAELLAREFELRGIDPPIHGPGPLPRNRAARYALAEVAKDMVAQQLTGAVESGNVGAFQNIVDNLAPEVRDLMGDTGFLGSTETLPFVFSWDDGIDGLRKSLEPENNLDKQLQQQAEAALVQLEDAAQIRDAIDAASRYGDERAIPVLQQIVEQAAALDTGNLDTIRVEQDQALAAIVSIGGEAADQSIIQLTEAEVVDAGYALKCLSKTKGDGPPSSTAAAWAASFLDRQVYNPSVEAERYRAMAEYDNALSVLQGTDDMGAIKAIGRMALERGDKYIGRRACFTLGTVSMEGPARNESYGVLRSIVSNQETEPWRRAAAAKALVLSGDSSSADIIRDAIQTKIPSATIYQVDPSDDIQLAAARLHDTQFASLMEQHSQELHSNESRVLQDVIVEAFRQKASYGQAQGAGRALSNMLASNHEPDRQFAQVIAGRLSEDAFIATAPALARTLRQRSTIPGNQRMATLQTIEQRVLQADSSAWASQVQAVASCAKAIRGTLRDSTESDQMRVQASRTLAHIEQAKQRSLDAPETKQMSIDAIKVAQRHARSENTRAQLNELIDALESNRRL
jgi:hypothetical protein